MDFKILFFSFLLASASAKSYKDYKVYNVVPKNEVQVEILNDLQSNIGVEFWEEHVAVGSIVKVMVAPEYVADMEKVVVENEIEHKLVIEDVQKLIDNQLRHATPRPKNTGFDFEIYHSLEEINSWLDQLAETYPNIVSIVVIGQSVEGRDIKGIKIDYKPEENYLIGMIEGAIHAREWISPASIIWIINEFLTSTDPAVRLIAENFEWHIFPVTNPDGYDYTFTTNRLWRKNRSRASSVSCAESGVEDDMSNGVDLNRNFDFVWDQYGTSSDPCSNTYAGTSAFSEPETRAIRDYVLNLNGQGQLVYYIALHSYSQLMLIPYSHVREQDALLSGNFADMYEIARRAAEVVEEKHNTVYSVGLSADLMYEMSGTSFDWVKYSTNVSMSYLFELRDLGDYGFLLPPEQIVPTGTEMVDALVEMDITSRTLGYYTISSAQTVLCSALLVALFPLLAVRM